MEIYQVMERIEEEESEPWEHSGSVVGRGKGTRNEDQKGSGEK